VRPAAVPVTPPAAPPPAARGGPRKGARQAEPIVAPSGPAQKPAGKVQIKERTDAGRLFLTIVVAAVIIGAVGFLIMKYL
jgi:hypothetical protein